MNEENYYDPEKPEEYVYDPENLNEFFEYLSKKEMESLIYNYALPVITIT